MIIENAFYKIPEVLMSYENINDGYEGNIVNLLMTAIVLEFNIRNIDTPLRLIRNEKIYPNQNSQRCDMFVNYINMYDERFLNTYNVQISNYIEAKYFGGINRNIGAEVKTYNSGAIIYDIYRLLQNTNTEDGKYFFVIFNDKPERYLALRRRTNNGQVERIWLKDLLNDGVHNIAFNLDEEPQTIRNLFGNIENGNIDFQAKTISIKPNVNSIEGFWCYLIKVNRNAT